MKNYRIDQNLKCSTHLCISGGLFDISESKQEVAFRYAVERINSNRKILPKSLLSAQIEKIPPQDSFHASKRGKKIQYRNWYVQIRNNSHDM